MLFDDLPPRIVSTLASDPDLGSLVQMYVEEMPERISTFAASYEAQNWEALRTLAHQTKGAAGSYGFEILSNLAGELEIACRQMVSQEAIQHRYQRLVEAMKRAEA